MAATKPGAMRRPTPRSAAAPTPRARENVPLGNAGAGLGAHAGALKGGQGSASIVTSDGFTVAALACVNCWGSTTMPGQRAFWAHAVRDRRRVRRRRARCERRFDAEDWGGAKFNPQPRANTTIACVAVDAELTPAEAKRVAQMASAGLARAIRPVFAPFDGDVVFALATARASHARAARARHRPLRRARRRLPRPRHRARRLCRRNRRRYTALARPSWLSPPPCHRRTRALCTAPSRP